MASPVAVSGVLPDYLDEIYVTQQAAMMGRVQIDRRHRRRQSHSAATASVAATPRNPSSALTKVCHRHRSTNTKPPLSARCGYDYLHQCRRYWTATSPTATYTWDYHVSNGRVVPIAVMPLGTPGMTDGYVQGYASMTATTRDNLTPPLEPLTPAVQGPWNHPAYVPSCRTSGSNRRRHQCVGSRSDWYPEGGPDATHV